MENSKIEWTDHTFNPWRGCAKVHEGCRGCYAEALAARNLPGVGPVIWGKFGTRVLADNWTGPERWHKRAAKSMVRTRVFCASLADVFEDWAGPMMDTRGNWWHQCEGCLNADGTPHRDTIAPYDERQYYEHACGEHFRKLTLADVRQDLFRLIDTTPWLDWQLVTKRPERIRDMWPTAAQSSAVPPAGSPALYRHNAWLLTSISSQATAAMQVPELLKCRDLSPVLGLSAEPLLSAVDLRPWLPGLDWVIVGGESDQPGHVTRPCAMEWIWDIVEQCQSAGVPCFVKQLGSFVVAENINNWERLWRLRTERYSAWGNFAASFRVSLDHHKGGNVDEWPEPLRVRQFPAVTVC